MINYPPLALIVEDNPILANMFSRALSDIQFQTHVISDGQDALDWLTVYEPLLLLLDMHLPTVSGEVILKSLHGDPRFAKTHIMIITADARMGEMLYHRADFLLNKPVDLLQLQQLAERLKRGKMQRV